MSAIVEMRGAAVQKMGYYSSRLLYLIFVILDQFKTFLDDWRVFLPSANVPQMKVCLFPREDY